jgi:glycosyl transferase family 25
MELLGGIVYINLDRRADRRAEIEAELKAYGLDAERFAAIEKNPGILGCSLSHLIVLRMARDRGWKNVLIFEDDFHFLVDRATFWERVSLFFRRHGDSFNVLMIDYCLQKQEPVDDLVVAALEATGAAAYIVSERFYDRLIGLYERTVPLLEATGQHWNYANDQAWKELQRDGLFLALVPRVGKQRPSFSDNRGCFDEALY